MHTETLVDLAIAVAACVVANVIFNNFERHLHWYRRVGKYVVMFAILGTVGLLAGRVVFWSLIGLITVGQVILHAWYFPRNGVSGLTAEPRERYLELITRMKHRRVPGKA